MLNRIAMSFECLRLKRRAAEAATRKASAVAILGARDARQAVRKKVEDP
ncbi:MAG TPA: hypothetical protein VM029_08645 [Opitutaceae bacterium]|nr:hypothetical protein [Opitutaceae bacterium]